MMLLALDLGTKTGFAVGEHPRPSTHGTWDLKPSRFSGGGMRFVRFKNQLDTILLAYSPDQVVFEEVRKHRGTDAAHAYGGFLATLQTWCEEHQIPYDGVPVGTIKRHWTGNGGVAKDVMIAEANRRGFPGCDDNEADSIALYTYWMEIGRKA